MVRASSGTYAMRPDGSGLRMARTYHLRAPDLPELSPDGRFAVEAKCGALFIARANGTHRRRVWDHPQSHCERDSDLGLEIDGEDWSPDGQRIVFSGTFGADTVFVSATVYTIRRDGSDLRVLYPAEALDRLAMTAPVDLRWLSTGEIVGRVPYQRGRSALVLMRSDGTRIRVLRRAPAGTHIYSLDSAPDGRKLVLVEAGQRNWIAVKIVDVRTRAVRTLIKLREDQYNRRSGVLPAAVWSPSGGRIAYILNPPRVQYPGGHTYWSPLGGAGIFTIGADGTDHRLIASRPLVAPSGPEFASDLQWRTRR